MLSPSMIVADTAAGCLILTLAYMGWRGLREWRRHSLEDWEKADRHRRAVRARILAEQRENDEVRGRIWLMQARVEDAVSAHCDALLASRPPAPERLLHAVTEEQLSVLVRG